MERGALAVRRARVACGGQIVEGIPKEGRARTVSIDPSTVAALRRWKAVQNAERLAWGEAWTDTGYLFTREDGQPLHPQTLANDYRRLVRRSGLPAIRFHDLRHTGATLALANGVPVKYRSGSGTRTSSSPSTSMPTCCPACRRQQPPASVSSSGVSRMSRR